MENKISMSGGIVAFDILAHFQNWYIHLAYLLLIVIGL